MGHMLRNGIALVIGFAIVAIATTRTSASPVFSPLTGSYYDVVDIKLTWTSAQTLAASMSYLGIQGRLATITSSTENDFIENNVLISRFGPGNSYWLGAFQPAGSAEPAGGFQWITGEPFSYSNWEPVSRATATSMEKMRIALRSTLRHREPGMTWPTAMRICRKDSWWSSRRRMCQSRGPESFFSSAQGC